MKAAAEPFAIVGFAGVTWMLTSAALVTVSVVEPEIVPSVAVIVVWLGNVATDVDARPCVGDAFEIVATVSSDDVQVTCVVRSCDEPSP